MLAARRSAGAASSERQAFLAKISGSCGTDMSSQVEEEVRRQRYRDAAANGDASAQVSLGKMLAEGLGGPKEEVEARRL